ncbi:MAG: hypothetical protein BJ554DRAFT_6974, partial [Olpidium bornovanus]
MVEQKRKQKEEENKKKTKMTRLPEVAGRPRLCFHTLYFSYGAVSPSSTPSAPFPLRPPPSPPLPQTLYPLPGSLAAELPPATDSLALASRVVPKPFPRAAFTPSPRVPTRPRSAEAPGPARSRGALFAAAVAASPPSNDVRSNWRRAPRPFDPLPGLLKNSAGCGPAGDRPDGTPWMESRYHALLNAVPDAIVIVDVESTIKFVNVQTERFFGYTKDELIGQPVEALIPERSRTRHRANTRQYVQHPITRPMGSGMNLSGRRKDGSEFPIDISLSSVTFDQEVFVISAIRDISERRRFEIEILQARQTAIEASRMKSEFLANMSHEIRTPMNGVLGMTELLARTTLSADQQSYVSAIQKSGDSLLKIINSILDFSKIEAGKLELERKPFDLLHFLEDIRQLMVVLVQEKGLHMLVTTGRDVPRYLKGDADRLRQILINLINNAIKFTDNGEIIVTIRMLEKDADLSSSTSDHLPAEISTASSDKTTETLVNPESASEIKKADSETSPTACPAGEESTADACTGADESDLTPAGVNADDAKRTPNLQSPPKSVVTVHFDIKDTGMGILETLQPHIFTAFTQGDTSVTRRQGGTGLGLTICKNLVDMMGGKIGFSSVVKGGSVFWFEVPLEVVKIHDVLRLPPSHPRRSSEEIKSARVLAVDDNQINLNIAKKMLETFKLKVDVVPGGQQACEQASKVHYDLIFMDCQMPDM